MISIGWIQRAGCVQRLSNIRACTRADTTGRSSRSALRLSWSVHHRSQTRWHSVDLALAFRSGVRAQAMSESHVRKVIDSAASCGPSDYESGGQEFESLRARQQNQRRSLASE
jgi:hypothetical protein